MASLEGVKVGDEILIEHGVSHSEGRLVARTTKTLVEDEHGTRWRRSDGRIAGRPPRSFGIRPAASPMTQEDRDHIRRRELTWRVCGVARADLEHATLGQLEAAWAAVEACKGGE